MLALEEELRRACLAGAIARLMAPFSISDEEASLAAMSQRLGWLLMRYHFPEEAAQMHRLMQPAPPNESGESASPGMSAEAAAGAVLGVDLDKRRISLSLDPNRLVATEPGWYDPYATVAARIVDSVGDGVLVAGSTRKSKPVPRKSA